MFIAAHAVSQALAFVLILPAAGLIAQYAPRQTHLQTFSLLAGTLLAMLGSPHIALIWTKHKRSLHAQLGWTLIALVILQLVLEVIWLAHPRLRKSSEVTQHPRFPIYLSLSHDKRNSFGMQQHQQEAAGKAFAERWRAVQRYLSTLIYVLSVVEVATGICALSSESLRNKVSSFVDLTC